MYQLAKLMFILLFNLWIKSLYIFFKQSILSLLCLSCSQVGQALGVVNDLTKLEGKETLLG